MCPIKTILLIVIILAFSGLVIKEQFYGMSPGTMDQLQSTSTEHPDMVLIRRVPNDIWSTNKGGLYLI
jgi:hypothetical protein